MSSDAEPDPFDLPALWSDLQDLEDDSMAPDKRGELTELLDRSPAARRAYLEYFQQAAVLRMEADKVMEKERLADIIKPLHVRAWWGRPWTAVAAALIMVAALGFLLVKKPDGVERMRAVASSGSQWEINGVRQAGEAQVNPGITIHVRSGTVKFHLHSGSIMVMQGPCEVGFPELRKPLVQNGLLWIDTGSTADSFEVSTADLMVRDIGTRFGVRVAENKRTEIHLHEGGVNVLSRESGIELVTLAASGKGHSISADGTLTELPIADDPFPGLQSQFSGGSDYRNAILAQNPTSYVKFDGGVEGRYDNEVRGRRTAKSGSSVSIHSVGINEESRFRGLDPDNKSIYFTKGKGRSRDTSVVAFLDGESGVSQRQGTVTFWVKQADGTKEDQILWLTGKTHPAKGAPTDSLAYTNITAAGYVGFSMENGNETVTLKSNQAIHDGKWHHIGITWGPNVASIYLDGRKVAHRSDVPTLNDWVSYGNYVRFGKPTDNLLRNGIQNFHGWLDEFAVWNRPLAPEELAEQYNAAIGTGGE